MSSAIPETVDDLEGKLFNDLNKLEAPKKNLPPPYPYRDTTGFLPHLDAMHPQAVVPHVQRQGGSIAMDQLL
jgi:hypothetical protein